MLDKADEELSGVVSTASTCLQLYLDPIVARATSASDFALRDLIEGPVPLSLYLVVPPSDLSRTRPLVRLHPILTALRGAIKRDLEVGLTSGNQRAGRSSTCPR